MFSALCEPDKQTLCQKSYLNVLESRYLWITPVTHTFPGRRELHRNLNSAGHHPPFSISCYTRALNHGAIMSFNDQDRSGGVTLSAAKGLARWAQRCFPFAALRAAAPALSMTVPVLVVTFHHRAATTQLAALRRSERKLLLPGKVEKGIFHVVFSRLVQQFLGSILCQQRAITHQP